MESFLGRYRNLIILVSVLSLQMLGLAVQVKTGAGQKAETRLIRLWAGTAITPFERALVWVQTSTGNLWHNYFYLRGVRAENRQLKEQIEQMRLEQVRLSEDAAQARRLQTLLAFKEQFVSKTVAAQVIGTAGSDLSRMVFIDKGENAGIRPDMAVITAEGIVGKVLLAGPNESRVLLISDQTSGVGAVLEKTRLQGVLRGTANGEVMLERVMSDEQVQPGETLLTSGGDQIFPKGLPVGTVARVTNGKDLFLQIKVRPAANLAKLEEVLVLTEKQERQAVAEDHGRVRAADILAQRLPSVPDKPATAAAVPVGTAPSTSGTANAAGTPAPKASPILSGNTTGAVKSASSEAASKPVGSSAQTPRIPTQTLTAPKPKPASSATNSAKPDSAQKPPAVEQTPAVAPATQPPTPDNNGPQ